MKQKNNRAYFVFEGKKYYAEIQYENNSPKAVIYETDKDWRDWKESMKTYGIWSLDEAINHFVKFIEEKGGYKKEAVIS